MGSLAHTRANEGANHYVDNDDVARVALSRSPAPPSTGAGIIICSATRGASRGILFCDPSVSKVKVALEKMEQM